VCVRVSHRRLAGTEREKMGVCVCVCVCVCQLGCRRLFAYISGVDPVCRRDVVYM